MEESSVEVGEKDNGPVNVSGSPASPQQQETDDDAGLPQSEAPIVSSEPALQFVTDSPDETTDITINGVVNSPGEPDKKPSKRKKKTDNVSADDGTIPAKKSKRASSKTESKPKHAKAKRRVEDDKLSAKTKKCIVDGKARRSEEGGAVDPSVDVPSEDKLTVSVENHVREDLDKVSNASLSPVAALIPGISEGRQRRTKSPKPGDFARKPRVKSPSRANEKSSPSDDDLPLAQLQSSLAASEISKDSTAIKKPNFEPSENSGVVNDNENNTQHPKKKRPTKKKPNNESTSEESKKKKQVSKMTDANDLNVMENSETEASPPTKPVKSKKVTKKSKEKMASEEPELPQDGAVGTEVQDSAVIADGTTHTATSPDTSENKDTVTCKPPGNKEGFEADIITANKIDSLAKPLLLNSTSVKLLPAVFTNSLPQDEPAKKSIDIYDMIDEDFSDLPIRPSGGHTIIEKIGSGSPRTVWLNIKENSEEGRCEKCGLILPTAAKLAKHVEQCEEGEPSGEQAEKPFKCNICDYRCKFRFKLRRHQQTHGIYGCTHCDLQAKSVAELEQHMKENHSDKPGNKLCKTCNTYVVWGEDFEEHSKNCHGKEPLKCSICSKEFKSRSKLKAHEPVHSKPKAKGVHQCTKCEYSCNDKSRFNRHLRNVHGEKIICQTCNEEFQNHVLLIRHMKVHTSFECPVCKKTFKAMKNLTAHQANHNAPDTFKCPEEGCQKAFKSMKLLREHQTETHNQNKKWQCTFDGCSQEFSKQSHLRRHEATHTGERKFKCDWPECGKAFRHADNLKVHYRQHTNEKPFSCSNCDFSCRQKSSLQWHLKRYHQLGSEDSDKSKSEAPSEDSSCDAATTPVKSSPEKTPDKPKTRKRPTKTASKARKATPVKEAVEDKSNPKKNAKTKKTARSKEATAKDTMPKESKPKRSSRAKKKAAENDEQKEKSDEVKMETVVEGKASEQEAKAATKADKDESENAEESGKKDNEVLESPVSEEEQVSNHLSQPPRLQASPTQEGYQSSNEEESSPLPPVDADARPHAPRPPSPVDDEEAMADERPETPTSPKPEESSSPQQADDDDENERASTRSLADDDYIAPSAPAPQPIEDPGITPPPQDIEPGPPEEPEYYPEPQSHPPLSHQSMSVDQEKPPSPGQDTNSVPHSVSSMMSPQPPKHNSVSSPPPMYSSDRSETNDKNESFSPHGQVAEPLSDHRDSYQSVGDRRDSYQSLDDRRDSYQSADDHRESYQAVEDRRDSYQSVEDRRDTYQPVSDRRDSYQSTDYAVPTPQAVENSHPAPADNHVYRERLPSPDRAVAPMYSSSQEIAGLPPPPTMSRDSGYSSSMMSTPGQYLQPPLPPATDYPRAMSCMPGLPNRGQDTSLFPPPHPSGNFYSQFLPPAPETSLPPVDDRYGSSSQRPPATLPQDQQSSSFHMLGRHNTTDFLRRASDIHKGYSSDLLQAGMHQTLPQSHWISQDERTRHWTQPTTLPLPPEIPPNPALSKESFLSVEREYEANRQLNKATPTFPTDPMSHLDMASMYMGRHFNPAAAAAAAAASSQNYQRQLPSSTNPTKPYEDTYRSHMPDYRTLSQTGGDMFRSMGMTAGFGLEKYYYPRDPMYRPQHLPSSSNPFMAQTAANQMNPYADRDYARNAAMYHQPYSFMGDKQYLDSRKLAQPPMPALTNRPLGAEYFTGAPPPNATQDPHFQDPYRRSVIYNMMNRYFE